MNTGSDPRQQRHGVSKRARALARRRERNERGALARGHPHSHQPSEWTVPSLASASGLVEPMAPSSIAPPAPPTPPVRPARPAPASVESPPFEVGSRSRALRRRQARRLRRARRQVVAALVVLVTLGGVLVAMGLTQVRSSTAGRYVDPSLQPDEPGYAAFVTPTPTLLVVQRAVNGQLGGVALLALQPGDEGGSVIVMPAATQVPFGEVDFTLSRAYAEQGVAGVTGLVEAATKVTVHDTVEVDDRRWATLVQPVGDVSLQLDAPVGTLPAGVVSLVPDEVGPFLTARMREESELNRTARQETFWRAWLEEVARGGDEAVAGEADSGFGRFVRGLALDPDVDSLPVAVVPDQTQEAFTVDGGLVAEQVARSVPFPQSPAPGVRPRMRLLNGTHEPELTASMADRLVGAGAEITISGNAGSFDETTTRILYSDPDLRPAATWYREILGIGVIELDSSGQDAEVEESERIDLTVILGADALEANQEVEEAD